MDSVASVVVWTVVVPLLVIVIIWAVVTRNSFVTRLNLVAESWRQVDVELRRRYDLIPNLVRVVQAYAEYERGLLESLTAARANAMTASSLPQRAGAEDNLGQAVHTVLVQAEAYPQLKASQQFLALQQELVNTEDRIAAGRRLYNGNVRALNTARNSFPSNIIGAMMGVAPAEYFETTDPAQRAVVPVPPTLGMAPGYPAPNYPVPPSGAGYPASGYPASGYTAPPLGAGYPAATNYPTPGYSAGPGYPAPSAGPGYPAPATTPGYGADFRP